MSNVQTIRPTKAQEFFYSVMRWFDSWAGLEHTKAEGPPKVDWVRSVPFIVLHLMCLGVIWVGWSWTAVAVTVAFYYIRMFAITGWYHRYFSHRTFKTTRTVQFLFALLGGTCTARSLVVGRPSSSSPHLFRHTGGCALPAPRRVLVVPYGLDHVADVLCASPQGHR